MLVSLLVVIAFIMFSVFYFQDDSRFNLTAIILVGKITLEETSWLHRRRPERPPSVTLGLSISIQPVAPVSPSVSCVNSNKMLMHFMYFRNSRTRNSDHHFFLLRLTMLMKKKCCHKLSLTFLKSVRGRDRKTDKNDDGCRMVVAFTMTEINYLVVSQFTSWCCPFPIYNVFVAYSWLAALFALLPV